MNPEDTNYVNHIVPGFGQHSSYCRDFFKVNLLYDVTLGHYWTRHGCEFDFGQGWLTDYHVFAMPPAKMFDNPFEDHYANHDDYDVILRYARQGEEYQRFEVDGGHTKPYLFKLFEKGYNGGVGDFLPLGKSPKVKLVGKVINDAANGLEGKIKLLTWLVTDKMLWQFEELTNE